MMFTNTFFILAIGALSELTAAAPADKQTRDVWDPRMTFPTASTVWESGKIYTVTWETLSKPAEVTNPIGHINLRFSNIEVPLVLADNFNLTDGKVDVTVPLVYTGSDYSLVLYGDSGDIGPEFTIIGFTP